MSDTQDLDAKIDRALRALRAGGVVIYPTETFYGLGAALCAPEGVARIALLKHRVTAKPLPVIAADASSARELWRTCPKMAAQLIERFWPGPLTIVLPASASVPWAVAPTGEVGVRMSSHPIARALAQGAGALVATSANFAQAGEQTRIDRLPGALLSSVDEVLDGGETPGGKPSTVLRLTGGRVQLLREGALPKSTLEEALGIALSA